MGIQASYVPLSAPVPLSGPRPLSAPRLEGDRAYLTGTCPFSFAQFATLGTRGLLGSAMNRYKDNRGSICAHACVRSEEGPEGPHSEGRKP